MLGFFTEALKEKTNRVKAGAMSKTEKEKPWFNYGRRLRERDDSAFKRKYVYDFMPWSDKDHFMAKPTKSMLKKEQRRKTTDHELLSGDIINFSTPRRKRESRQNLLKFMAKGFYLVLFAVALFILSAAMSKLSHSSPYTQIVALPVFYASFFFGATSLIMGIYQITIPPVTEFLTRNIALAMEGDAYDKAAQEAGERDKRRHSIVKAYLNALTPTQRAAGFDKKIRGLVEGETGKEQIERLGQNMINSKNDYVSKMDEAMKRMERRIPA